MKFDLYYNRFLLYFERKTCILGQEANTNFWALLCTITTSDTDSRRKSVQEFKKAGLGF